MVSKVNKGEFIHITFAATLGDLPISHLMKIQINKTMRSFTGRKTTSLDVALKTRLKSLYNNFGHILKGHKTLRHNS